MPTHTQVLEVHLEEVGQRSWLAALANTVTGSFGSAQFRFVARPPDDHAGTTGVLGATFPLMRWQDLNDELEPNAWLDIARKRLEELDGQLLADGWKPTDRSSRHWWSRTYTRDVAESTTSTRS